MGLGRRYGPCQPRAVSLAETQGVSGCQASLIVIITLITPIFKPYYYDDYLRFCFSEEGMMQQCKLVAYCGTDATKEADA